VFGAGSAQFPRPPEALDRLGIALQVEQALALEPPAQSDARPGGQHHLRAAQGLAVIAPPKELDGSVRVQIVVGRRRLLAEPTEHGTPSVDLNGSFGHATPPPPLAPIALPTLFPRCSVP